MKTIWRIHRCRSATVDLPQPIWRLSAGAGWSFHTQRVTLCDDLGHAFEAWLLRPHRTHQDGLGEALIATAVASMDLVGAGMPGAENCV